MKITAKPPENWNRETPPFSIEVKFLAEPTPELNDACRVAAERWTNVIIGGVDPITMKGEDSEEKIDGLLVMINVGMLDNRLGLSGETRLDPKYIRTSGAGAGLPAKATITLDVEDLRRVSDDFLVDLVTHEMGHALGFNRRVWEPLGLLRRDEKDTAIPLFFGVEAARTYRELYEFAGEYVPLENYRGEEKRLSHLKQSIFHTELMTTVLEATSNPIGPVTVAILHDMGYEINPGAAESQKIDLLGTGQDIIARAPVQPADDVRGRPAAAGEAAAVAAPRLRRRIRPLGCTLDD
jgi:hypothetical protein